MQRKDPYAGFRFVVEIDNVQSAGFSEVSGMSAETETEDIQEGGINDYVHKLVKVTKFPHLVLKRGLIDSAVWSWYQDVLRGNVKRKLIAVVLQDYRPKAKEKAKDDWRWVFSEAFPVKWSSGELNAASGNVVVETIEFAHHGMIKQ